MRRWQNTAQLRFGPETHSTNHPGPNCGPLQRARTSMQRPVAGHVQTPWTVHGSSGAGGVVGQDGGGPISARDEHICLHRSGPPSAESQIAVHDSSPVLYVHFVANGHGESVAGNVAGHSDGGPASAGVGIRVATMSSLQPGQALSFAQSCSVGLSGSAATFAGSVRG